MLVRSRPLLGLVIFGNWRLSFFTSTSHFQDLLGTPGGSGPSHFAPSAELCGSVGAAGVASPRCLAAVWLGKEMEFAQ